MPAPAVIPALIVYSKVVVVKTLVFYSHDLTGEGRITLTLVWDILSPTARGTASLERYRG